MSWKSIVITGLLCVVASPVLADPSVGGQLLGLDVNGNWVWAINATPDAALFADNPPNGVGGSVAIEVAATASGRDLVSAAADATNFPANNPGVAPAGFAFWAGTDTGVEANVATNELFAALGSTYFTTGGAKEALRVRTQGPTSTALTTTLTLSGGHSGNGRIAQDGQNYDNVTGALNGAVRTGNANLDGSVGPQDLVILGGSWNTSGKHWQQGDFDGNGTVGPQDLVLLGGQWSLADANWTTPGLINIPAAGAGSIAASAVPEPSALLLVALSGASVAMFRRRR